jgi:NAD-dependent SIR2 family protein deacetylase
MSILLFSFCSQFHQRFLGSFCANIIVPKKFKAVIGSSLQVFSGDRIVLQAKEEGKCIAILNIEPTRAHHLADLKVHSRAGDVLSQLL